ncbi:MAG: OmpA family protein [bacterium]|nr:OmpA family protein [bacterium]
MRLALIVALLSGALMLLGCASRGYVDQQTAATNERIDGVVTQVEHAQTDIQEVEERTDRNEAEVEELSKTAQEALDRAIEAGKLADGKFLYETVLTDEAVQFGFDRADLSDEARAALDDFAAGVKSRNEDVYIEIQGHTDSVGPESYNQKLGLERAEAVRRYLSREQGFALHRISVISYGESEPMVANDNRENRSKNRRVLLVVLK